MSSKASPDLHNPALESGAEAPDDGSQIEADSSPPVKFRTVEPEGNEDEHDPWPDTASNSSSEQETDDSSVEHSESPSAAPQITSSPCTCHCGGCCCHGTSPEPQHCVRCHANYRLNHPEACMVPHVFTADQYFSQHMVYGDVSVPSTCCGCDVWGGDPRKGDWNQPFPCFMGWHTTNVEAVEEQYNGVNVLRCTSRHGKCSRPQMKHSAKYELLYDEEVPYIQDDEGDHEFYLQRKRKELNNDSFFEDQFLRAYEYDGDSDSEDEDNEDNGDNGDSDSEDEDNEDNEDHEANEDNEDNRKEETITKKIKKAIRKTQMNK